MDKLNIGCGDVHLPGFINVDLPDFDATKPWAYETASMKVVNADCLLPHIMSGNDLDFLINECARVLIPGRGVFTFSAPDWRNPSEALQDVHHYRLIGPRTFYHYQQPKTARPLEAGGQWFLKPSWHEQRVLKTKIEGQSRYLPNLLRIGSSNLGVLSHVALRMKAINFLRSGRLNWHMRRNDSQWMSDSEESQRSKT